MIELLIVVAIIGIIAALLIPNLLDALQKAKQKRTMADMRIVGTSMMAWLTDESGAAAAGAQANSVDLSLFNSISLAELEEQLQPIYLQEVPPLDGWKQPVEYFLDLEDPLSTEVMAIRSNGRDLIPDGDAYIVGPFTPTDYDQDLVWTDGFFIRWPQNLNPN